MSGHALPDLKVGLITFGSSSTFSDMALLIRTNSDQRDFQTLVQLLDAVLAVRDGEEHAFYATYNKVDLLQEVIVAYLEDEPVACGAIRRMDKETAEIKRMYTHPDHRGKGIARQVLSALEAWATELGHNRTILETGKKQPEAIALYTREGYRIIANYGPYIGVDNSVCFEKTLTPVRS